MNNMHKDTCKVVLKPILFFFKSYISTHNNNYSIIYYTPVKY